MKSVKTSDWGKWNMNDPVLWAISELTFNPLYNTTTYDKFITLSGDSYPTMSQSYLHYLFGSNGPLKSYNFVTSIWCETGLRPTKYSEFPQKWHKRKAYPKPILLKLANSTKKVDIFYGSQWMMLNSDFVAYMGRSLHDSNSFPSKLKDRFIEHRNVVTDEVYFPTILMNEEQFAASVPNVPKGQGLPGVEWLKTVRYERMDEHMPSCTGVFPDTQRYVAPANIEPRVWGPYFLGINDLQNIKMSGALFFRKISDTVEANLYNLFPVDLREDVDRLPVIDWGRETDYQISPRPTFREQNDQNRQKNNTQK